MRSLYHRSLGDQPVRYRLRCKTLFEEGVKSCLSASGLEPDIHVKETTRQEASARIYVMKRVLTS